MNTATALAHEHEIHEVPVDSITDVFVWDRKDKTIAEVLESAWINAGGAEAIPVVGCGTKVEEWVASLLAHVQQNHGNEVDFNVQLVMSDGQAHVFRAFRASTVDGPLLALRRVAGQVPLLSELLLPPWWERLMLQEDMTRDGGLIILCAPNGRGKSTTLGALIRSRLEAFGGHARTVENPVELPLNGRWGDGVCVQQAVDTESNPKAFSEALRRTMTRGFPASPGNIIMVGEVRDADTAAEVVKASVTGLLVLATVHGDSPIGAVQRLCAYAAGEGTSHEVVRDMVGSSLRLAIYQDMKLNPNPKASGWKSRIIQGEVLISDGLDHPTGASIRAGRFDALKNNLDRCNTLMSTTPAPIRDHQQATRNLIIETGKL